MTDPQTELRDRFAAALGRAFGPEHAGTDPLIRPSAFGDYQANVALPLAKSLGRPPREVAGELLAALDLEGVADAEVSGPGFVNLTVRDGFLAAGCNELLGDGRAGIAPAARPGTVVVDYSAPNVAKEMHVGHLRGTSLGDALVRLLELLGHRVVRQNHLGDWGTQFGMLIEHLFDAGATDPDHPIEDLGTFYRQAREKFDHDPAFAERSRARVVALQSGDEATLRLWQRLVDVSKEHFNALYRWMGVLLDDGDLAGESLYNPMLAGVVDELEGKGLAVPSEGALCVFPPGFSGRDGRPLPLIVRKRDGGFGYAATDLAAIRYRLRDLGADRLVYVVGTPQSLHLSMVFATARLAGWLGPGASAEHVAFGSILDSDGKMMRSRSGDPAKLADLVEEAVERATKIVGDRGELPAGEQAAVARAVGVGALKYASLSYANERDFVFDWDRMLAFDGNTGPYLQYAVTRIRSIFRRAGLGPTVPGGSELPPDTSTVPGLGVERGAPVDVAHPAERALALRLLELDGVAQTVATTLEPHRLCAHLYETASAFTGFYEQCPVLNAGDEATRRSRLALAALSERSLTLGLGLLGIDTPDRM